MYARTLALTHTHTLSTTVNISNRPLPSTRDLCSLADSPHREIFTTEILRLKEAQKIHEWKTKWWQRELGAKECLVEEGAKGSASELTVDNVGGVFVVLIGGVVAGFFVAMCEFLWKARKLSLIHI